MNTYSLRFDSGNNAYLYHSINSNLLPSGDFTVECWVKLNSNTQDAVVINVWANNQKAYRCKFFISTGFKPEAYVSNDGSSQGNPQDNQYAVGQDAWHHVAWVNSSGTMYFFVDGVQRDSGGGASSIFNSNATFYVGNPNGFTGAYFVGKMDDLRLWNVARTASQISTNMSRELAGNEANLIAYWKFNNDYTDATGNGNTLNTSGTLNFDTDVPFTDNTTTSTSITTSSSTSTSTSSSTTTTSTSTSMTTTSTSITTSTSSSTSSTISTTSTSITTSTTTSSSTSTTMTTTSTSTTTTSTSTSVTTSTSSSTSTSVTTSTSTSTTSTLTDFELLVERTN